MYIIVNVSWVRGVVGCCKKGVNVIVNTIEITNISLPIMLGTMHTETPRTEMPHDKLTPTKFYLMIMGSCFSVVQSWEKGKHELYPNSQPYLGI